MDQNFFPLLITYEAKKERVFTLVDTPEKLPVDTAFEIVMPQANEAAKNLATKMYNKGWIACKEQLS